jgi:hypothetical protein
MYRCVCCVYMKGIYMYKSPQTTRLLTLSRKDFLKLYIKQWILLSRVFLIFLTIKFTTGHKVSVDIIIYQNVSVTNGHGYIPFVVIVIRSFPLVIFILAITRGISIGVITGRKSKTGRKYNGGQIIRPNETQWFTKRNTDNWRLCNTNHTRNRGLLQVLQKSVSSSYSTPSSIYGLWLPLLIYPWW